MKVNILLGYIPFFTWLIGFLLILKNYLDYAIAGGFCLGWAPGCLPMELVNIIFGVIFLAWTLFIWIMAILFKYLRSRKSKPTTK